ncbi:MAG: hypothetical protein FE834_10545 [Gammaproteobacteria bacterium]|nr:hypothetical protein [Gammaproteobacteria bacterium]
MKDKIFNITALSFSIFLFLPSAVSGLGIFASLWFCVVCSVSALFGRIKLSIAILIITSINIFFFSVASISWMPKEQSNPDFFIPPVPIIGVEHFSKEVMKKFAKDNNIPYDENAEIEIIDAKQQTKLSALFDLVIYAIPYYIITILLIVIGVNKRSE